MGNWGVNASICVRDVRYRTCTSVRASMRIFLSIVALADEPWLREFRHTKQRFGLDLGADVHDALLLRFTTQRFGDARQRRGGKVRRDDRNSIHD
jgi:hypothetical protein